MILSTEYQDLNVAVLGNDYTIFITSNAKECFICHTRQTCPTKNGAEQVNQGMSQSMLLST